MDHLIEVAFKGNRKEFYLWEGDAPPPIRSAVIVEADRGEDLGRVNATGELAAKRASGVSHAPSNETPPKRVRRLATSDDLKRYDELRAQDEQARRRAMERVKANNLVMKLSDAEWQWDRRKLTIYFTAEKRVDFRNLVRDLASLFRTRIELKQIGVRDEARRLGGIGRCGREYCSASWLPELRPVNLGVAKDQRLSLNPSQISGACGRLMCCLRYEHEFYVQSRKRFPKEGKVLVTARGEEKVVANDIFNDRVTLRNPEGETRVLPLAELKREMAGGPVVEEPTVEEEPDLMLELDEEVIRMTDTAERPAFRPGFRPGPLGASSLGQRPVSLQRRPGSPPPDTGAGAGSGVGGPAGGAAAAPEPRGSAGPRTGATSGNGEGKASHGAGQAPGRSASQAPAPPVTAAGAAGNVAGVGGGPAGTPGNAAEAQGVVPGGTSAAAAEESADETPRAPRRRRGRRGGRRGRGRGAGGEAQAAPNAGGPGALPDDGDDGGEDE